MLSGGGVGTGCVWPLLITTDPGMWPIRPPPDWMDDDVALDGLNSAMAEASSSSKLLLALRALRSPAPVALGPAVERVEVLRGRRRLETRLVGLGGGLESAMEVEESRLCRWKAVRETKPRKDTAARMPSSSIQRSEEARLPPMKWNSIAASPPHASRMPLSMPPVWKDEG